MISERDLWSNGFGQALGVNNCRQIPVDMGMAWRLGRFIVHVHSERLDASAISISATEDPAAGERCYDGAAYTKTFEYFLDNDPYVVGQMVIRWIRSR